jgi:hypothetical protein
MGKSRPKATRWVRHFSGRKLDDHRTVQLEQLDSAKCAETLSEVHCRRQFGVFQAIKSPHKAGVLSAIIIVIELSLQLDPSSVTYFIIIIS